MRTSTPSSTAQNVALARSHLTWLGVLADPVAESMLRPRWAAVGKALRRRAFARWGRSSAITYVAVRTCFYDDAVTRAIDDGIRQVVVIAAGYDSRAWRLARPGVRFFEVDHPATQADKRRRAPAGGPCYVPVEFGVDALEPALRTAGFTTGTAAIFVVEGVTMYLTEHQVRELLHTLRDLSGPGSRLAVNFGLGTLAANASGNRPGLMSRIAFALQGERITLQPPPPEDAPDFLAATGWTTRRLHTVPDLVRHYLPGTDLPTAKINPAAYAVEASVDGR